MEGSTPAMEGTIHGHLATRAELGTQLEPSSVCGGAVGGFIRKIQLPSRGREGGLRLATRGMWGAAGVFLVGGAWTVAGMESSRVLVLDSG